jgi:serine/threonine protein kinase
LGCLDPLHLIDNSSMEITGFEILRKIDGSGAVQIFEAKQLSLDRIVTLKVLEPKFSSNLGEVKDFVSQAREVAHFKHPNVVEIYDIGEENGIFYIAVEHVVGKTLREMVDEHGAMPFARVVKIALQVSRVLQAAAEKAKLVHKAISPDTILISEDGWVKISGFGQALPSDTRTLEAFIKAGLLDGNTHFMTPEQAKEETHLDARTDMYSMGATIYYLLTGKEPFHEYKGVDALKRHISEHLVHPRELKKTIPASMCLFLAKMMMKAPHDRYANWGAVLSDLDKASHGKLVTIQPGWEELSTISPIKSPAALKPDTKELKKQKRATAVPSWIRIPVWTLLIMWWILVAACLLRDEIKDVLDFDPVEEMSR